MLNLTGTWKTQHLCQFVYSFREQGTNLEVHSTKKGPRAAVDKEIQQLMASAKAHSPVKAKCFTNL